MRSDIFYEFLIFPCHLYYYEPFGFVRFATDHSDKDRFVIFEHSCLALLASNNNPYTALPLYY